MIARRETPLDNRRAPTETPASAAALGSAGGAAGRAPGATADPPQAVPPAASTPAPAGPGLGAPAPGVPVRERRGWLLGFVLGVVLLPLVGGLLALAFVLAAGSPPRAVLLLGIDVRPDEQRRGMPGHTDTIAVLALQPSGGATLISFPRDLWVDIPGYGPERLNVAYALGAQTGGPGGGSALLARTLAAEFGLSVDRWARVDFRGFVAAVDALGGIDVTVPRTLVDETYPTDDYGTRRLVIPAGQHHFDGAQALAYARTRAPDSDFGRIARQQQVLVALREQALTPGGLVRLPIVLAVLPRAVSTDLPPPEMAALLRTLATLPRDRVRTLVIGPELATPRVGPGGAAILSPHTAAIREVIAEALAGR